MEYTKQLEVIEQMNRTTLGTKKWWYRVEDLDAANELLETAVRLMGIALGDFDVTNDLHMLDAQRKAVTLVEMSCDEKPDADICMMLPGTLTESRVVNQILARMAAQWLTQASKDQARANLYLLRQRINDAELRLADSPTNEGEQSND